MKKIIEKVRQLWGDRNITEIKNVRDVILWDNGNPYFKTEDLKRMTADQMEEANKILYEAYGPFQKKNDDGSKKLMANSKEGDYCFQSQEISEPGLVGEEKPPERDVVEPVTGPEIRIIGEIVPVLDVNSPTWKFAEEYLTERLETLRKMNDSRLLDFPATQELRGRIAEVKKLMKLPESLEKGRGPHARNIPTDKLGEE